MQSEIKNFSSIDVFSEDNPLSNYYLVPVEIGGITFPSAEHAYQALKFLSPTKGGYNSPIIIEIRNAETPSQAKEIAHNHEAEMTISDISQKVMIAYEVMRSKFFQNYNLRMILLETNLEILFEQCLGTSENDRFWGVDIYGDGENVIGNILMHIREECSGNEIYQY